MGTKKIYRIILKIICVAAILCVICLLYFGFRNYKYIKVLKNHNYIKEIIKQDSNIWEYEYVEPYGDFDIRVQHLFSFTSMYCDVDVIMYKAYWESKDEYVDISLHIQENINGDISYTVHYQSDRKLEINENKYIGHIFVDENMNILPEYANVEILNEFLDENAVYIKQLKDVANECWGLWDN